MKQIILYLTAVLIVFQFGSCEKHTLYSKHCLDMPKQIEGGTGEIINNVLIEQTESYDDNEWVITSDSLNISGSIVSFNNGINYEQIDFSKYSLLGKFARGGCTAFFDRNVTKDVKKKKC